MEKKIVLLLPATATMNLRGRAGHRVRNATAPSQEQEKTASSRSGLAKRDFFKYLI